MKVKISFKLIFYSFPILKDKCRYSYTKQLTNIIINNFPGKVNYKIYFN